MFHSRTAVHLVALLSGGALVLAFAPFHLWPLALLSPALLMLLWLKTPARWAVSIGYAYGLGLFGFGVSWVFHSIHEFGQAPWIFAALLTLVFVLVMALYPAALGWLQRAGPGQRVAWRLLLVVPAGWIWLEWLRGWLFTGFPWLQLGYSQLLADGSTPFAAAAPVAGVLGAGYLLLLAVGATMALPLARRSGRAVAVLLLGVVVALLYGLAVPRWSQPEGEPIEVALVQGNIAQENKWDPDWLLPTVERYTGLTRDHYDADLILWPEVALPGTYRLFRQYVLEPMASELAASGAELLTGILYEGRDGRVYNSIIEIGDDSEVYFKRHLVPFGEFMPLRQWMGWLDRFVLVATDDIWPGHEATLLHAAGQVIGSSICYEDAFGEEMADFLPEATLLVNLSNDAWFGGTFAPAQHLQIARMRALELGRPLLRATNTGITAIVDARGKVVARAPASEAVVLRGRVAGHQGYTPFARWRNGPLIGLLTLLLVVALAMKYYEGKSR